MLKIILVLLAVWLVLSILGFAIKGLFWLAIIGLILFAVTAIWGGITSKRGTR
jgi:uncharacterized membrane protein